MVKVMTSREQRAELQAQKLAAFIEVACALRRLRNFQSLEVIMQALQSFELFKLDQAWIYLRAKHPVHFTDYTKLCSLVNQSSSNLNLLRAEGPCLPSLNGLISLMRLLCASKWDLLEHRPRWTESPNLSAWLEKQAGNVPKFTKTSNISSIPKDHAFHEANDVQASTLLPENDVIRFIPIACLPKSWTSRDVRRIPVVFKRPVLEAFLSWFEYEQGLVRRYTIFNGQNRVDLALN